MQLRFLLLVLLPLFATARDVTLKVETSRISKSNMGIFWVQQETGTEQLVKVMKPGQMAGQNTHFGHDFILRSSDFDFHMKIWVTKSKDPSRPYKISFKNVIGGNNAGVELKLAAKDFRWIESGDVITRNTDVMHQVEMRRGGIPVAWVSLHEIVAEEL